ncbi:NAD(P)/FAD-dependent oxidoreductase [Thermodesulfobacteriota bacterium]
MAEKKARPSDQNSINADVVVVGAGPAGTVAAKKCAEKGMDTLLLEKRKLPRRKVCTGLIISTLAHTIISEEFGDIPQEAITDPGNIVGYQWHSDEAGDEKQEMTGIVNIWRKELDHWMNLKATDAGVRLWDDTSVSHVIQEQDGITLQINKSGQDQKIRARYVIGADGSGSLIRRQIFPDLDPYVVTVLTECHPGSLDADRNYLHLFGSPQTTPNRDWFDVIHKKGCFLLNCSNDLRPAKESHNLAKKLLTEKWGFNPESKPLWTDATIGPVLTREVRDREFFPARGNVLLAGYAAGLSTPSERGEGEAINMALKGGLMASSAVIKAADTSREAADTYEPELQKYIDVTKTLEADMLHYTTHWEERDKVLSRLL